MCNSYFKMKIYYFLTFAACCILSASPAHAQEPVQGGTDTAPLDSLTSFAEEALDAQAVNVLLLSNRSYNNAYIKSAFLSNMSGFSFDTHSVYEDGIPTLSQLEQYDVVLLYENGLMGDPRPQQTGNVVEQYVQGGGGLVIGTFYWQDRSDNTIYNRTGWGSLENIDPFTCSSVTRPGSEYNNDTLDAGSIVAHPLTAGLNSMSGYYHGGVAAKSGTTVVANWSDGIPLIGFSSDHCIVAISHFPAHYAYGGVSGDFYQMWENALNWAAACGGEIEVVIDIKPGSFPNSINVDSKGVIPVAILGTEDFDASTVEPTTVGFGPDDALPVHWALEDVDGDGDIDWVFHFKVQDTGISEGDTEATLTGRTTGGIPISGTDSVRTVPPKGKK